MKAAVQLGRRGGKASAAAMTPEERRVRASRAGKAASDKLTAGERHERARLAAHARWGDPTHRYAPGEGAIHGWEDAIKEEALGGKP